MEWYHNGIGMYMAGTRGNYCMRGKNSEVNLPLKGKCAGKLLLQNQMRAHLVFVSNTEIFQKEINLISSTYLS